MAKAQCLFPEYFGSDDRCCICGELIRLCPPTFDDAIRHAKRSHGVSDVEESRARFVASLDDPSTVIHADADEDEEHIGLTRCGLHVDFGMVVASHPDLATCPTCKSA